MKAREFEKQQQAWRGSEGIAQIFTIDRFWIKIWTENASGAEEVVYDNALAMTALQANQKSAAGQ